MKKLTFRQLWCAPPPDHFIKGITFPTFRIWPLKLAAISRFEVEYQANLVKMQLTTDPTGFDKTKLPELRCHNFTFAEPKENISVCYSRKVSCAWMAIWASYGVGDQNCDLPMRAGAVFLAGVWFVWNFILSAVFLWAEVVPVIIAYYTLQTTQSFTEVLSLFASGVPS